MKTWTTCRADELQRGDIIECKNGRGDREVKSIRPALKGLVELWCPPNYTQFSEPDEIVKVYR